MIDRLCLTRSNTWTMEIRTQSQSSPTQPHTNFDAIRAYRTFSYLAFVVEEQPSHTCMHTFLETRDNLRLV